MLCACGIVSEHCVVFFPKEPLRRVLLPSYGRASGEDVFGTVQG